MSGSGCETVVALLSGADRPGIVAGISGWVFERGGNIIHADQHHDQEEEIFFQRIEWSQPETDFDEIEAEFKEFAASLGMVATLAHSSHRPKFAVLVSKFDHCFHDLVLRWKAGEFCGDIACVISNHAALADASEAYGLPFYHVPVSPEGKVKAEKKQLEILRKHDVKFAVLARYMQVLSGDFLKAFNRPVINIHHSFLPAFAGGKPYHQAHARGVRLIGPTANDATDVLDDGPILQQDVARVIHRHNVKDLIRKGRDLEKMVLSQAISWHLDNRVLIYGRKTVVFD